MASFLLAFFDISVVDDDVFFYYVTFSCEQIMCVIRL